MSWHRVLHATARLRGTLAALVVAIAVVLIGTDAASAATVSFVPAFGTGYLGSSGSVNAAFSITGTEYAGAPQPINEVVVDVPAGVSGSHAGLPTCSPATLTNIGPAGCPAGSLAGAAGRLKMVVSFGNERVPETASLQAFFAPEEGLDFYFQGTSPVALEATATATYTDANPPYSRALKLAIPTIETVPAAPLVSITSIELALGASHEEGGVSSKGVVLPPVCPESGAFRWAGRIGFYQSGAQEVTAQSACPAAAPPPIIAQRQTVDVIAGTLTVRPRGTSAFVPLVGANSIPDGSEVDATNGSALMTAATPTPGQTETAEVHGGRFQIDQERAGSGETHLTLSLPLTGCPRARLPHGSVSALATGAKHRSRPRARQLWVSEKGGSWGTNGRYVSTSVEGTHWLTLDECDKSEVKVVSGKVRVHDLVRNKTKTLTAGKSYVAINRRFG
jgi:hypothetical protein